MTDERIDAALKVERRCENCRFASSERPNPAMLVPVLMCRYGPLAPVAILVPGPGGQVATQVRALAPAVAPADWCHRFEAVTLPGN